MSSVIASPRSYSIQLSSFHFETRTNWGNAPSVATDTSKDLEGLDLLLSPLPVIDDFLVESEIAPGGFFMGPGCESYAATTIVESPSSIPSLLGLVNTHWEPAAADVLVSSSSNMSTSNNGFFRAEPNHHDDVPSEKLLKPIELLPEYEDYESSDDAMDVDEDYNTHAVVANA